MTRPPRFDPAWQRRRWARRWRGLRWLLLLAAILAVWAWWQGLALPPGGEWEAVERRVTVCAGRQAQACAIDGDTLMLGQRRIRLTGYDAPELDGACEAERLLARRARGEVAGWLSAGPFELDGGADPPRDRYGRELRAARRVSGGRAQWLDDHMIAAGLARRDDWGRAAGWCAQPSTKR